MPSWDDLRYVLAVRRHGSLGRAARALGLNKSTVSRRVAALEEELGVKLLQRESRGYELTKAGLEAATKAEQMERLIGELVSTFGGIDRRAVGDVRVTVPAWFAQHILIPKLPKLRETYPGLDVHLVTTDDVLDIAQRQADIGIRNVRPKQQSLIARKGGEVDFAMYASKEYVARHGIPADKRDFEGHQLVAYRSAVAHVDAYRWANALPCPIACRAADAASMLDAVATGLGLGVLPCLLAETNDRLVCAHSVGGPQPEVIWLVTHPEARDTEKVRVVMKWLVDLFAQNAERLAGRRIAGP